MASMGRRVLLIATGESYTEGVYITHAKDSILHTLGNNKVVLFVPYAWAEDNYDKYFELFRRTMESWGVEATSIHHSHNPVDTVMKAQAIFIGGGNTFRLLASLHHHPGLCQTISRRVIQDGVPYMGVSAGAVVATPAILTTGSKPIAYPPTLRGLGLVPYLVVPHVTTTADNTQGPVSCSTQGKESDIFEVANLTDVPPVVGLPDGSMLSCDGNAFNVLGPQGAFLYERYNKKRIIQSGSELPEICSAEYHIPDSIAGPTLSSLP